jgi:hypothetical protein
MLTPASFRFRHMRRSGTVYIAVLGTAIIVAVIGISSLHIARLEFKESTIVDNMSRARLAAKSGVDYVMAYLKTQNNWRTAYTSGTTNQLSTLLNLLPAGESFAFQLVDSDGDLDDDESDPVTLRLLGHAGDATHVIEVTLAPTGQGLTCLTASVHAQGNLEINETLTTDQSASSNANIVIAGSKSIQGNAQAVGSVTGTVSGTRTNGMNPALEMPEPDTVFDFYTSVATPIFYSQLPSGKIEEVVISAANNPYGSGITNAQGVYVIDCLGNKVTIIDSRIQATLVFLNASTIEVEKSIYWTAFANNYPALLVDGKLHFKWTGNTGLSESILGVNYNPSHTPYEGASDTVNDDNYPGLISGLVYASSDLDVTEPCNLAGVLVVGGRIKFDKQLTMDYKTNYFQNAPPGFTNDDEVEILPGTWKQAAY